MRQFFNILRKWRSPVLLKDEYLGEFQGNILQSVARFFPQPAAAHILGAPALNARWKVYERVLWQGNRGHRFYTQPAVCERLHALCSQVYEAHHKDEHYPNYFDGRADGLPLVCIDEGYFVIWNANQL